MLAQLLALNQEVAAKIERVNLSCPRRAPLGLIPGLDNLNGFVLLGSGKAGAFAGFGIDAVEGAATVAPSDQTVTCFHGFPATATIKGTDSEVLPGKWSVSSRNLRFSRSTEIGVRFGVHFGPSGSQLLAAKEDQLWRFWGWQSPDWASQVGGENFATIEELKRFDLARDRGDHCTELDQPSLTEIA